MPRIFASLSLFALALMLANIVYGLIGGDYNGFSAQLSSAQAQSLRLDSRGGEDASQLAPNLDDMFAQLKPFQSHFRLHILLGILAALVTVLVQSIGITYFIGTGRWGKEVVTTYQLPAELIERGSRLKRRAFPWAMLGMGVVLLIVCFGAAADPGTGRKTTADWVQPHLWSSVIGTIVIAAALWLQVRYITENQQLIETIVAAVHEIRVARGLPVENESTVRVSVTSHRDAEHH